jgi:hypothetical protein
MKKFCSIALVAMFLTSCSSFGPKPHVLYSRPDLETKVSKVIVFPTTDFEGKTNEGLKAIDLSVNTAWVNAYGADKVIPAGILIEKISNKIGGGFYKKFISTLDNISAVEQISQNEVAKKFVSEVTNKFGNFQFALAIVSGNEASYNSGNPVYMHIGLFDTKNLTWKLITKIEVKKGAVGNWKVDSQLMISNSFEEIKRIIDVKNSK